MGRRGHAGHASSPAGAGPGGRRQSGGAGAVRRGGHRPWLIRAWCRGLGRLKRCQRAVADGVDEAVREGGGGLFDRERSAGSDVSQLGAGDAGSVGRSDLAGEGRPVRVGGDTGMDLLGEACRCRFECRLVSAGFGDAQFEPPLQPNARAIVRGWSGWAEVGVGDIACCSPNCEVTREIGIAKYREAQTGAACWVQRVAAARTAVPWRSMRSWRRAK
jgi:hypothetical protein